MKKKNIKNSDTIMSKEQIKRSDIINKFLDQLHNKKICKLEIVYVL